MNEQMEYEYILECIESSEDLDEMVVMKRLRCLWTAYCLHHDIGVGTDKYDSKMQKMWKVMQENKTSPYLSDKFERFSNAMSSFLV